MEINGSIKKKTKARNPELEILKYINEKPSGVTITEISRKLSFSRNTVSKYVSLLELKNKIVSRKVGAYHLYFNTEMKLFSKMFTIAYYKALLAGLKDGFPGAGDIFKEIGRNSLEFIDNYLKPTDSKKLKSVKPERILTLYYDVFGKFYPSLNIIQPNIELSTSEMDGNIKFILKLTNSEFLDDPHKFIYHFYIIAGLIEAIWKRETNKDVVCNVGIHVSDDTERSYIELSIELKKP